MYRNASEKDQQIYKFRNIARITNVSSLTDVFYIFQNAFVKRSIKKVFSKIYIYVQHI